MSCPAAASLCTTLSSGLAWHMACLSYWVCTRLWQRDGMVPILRTMAAKGMVMNQEHKSVATGGWQASREASSGRARVAGPAGEAGGPGQPDAPLRPALLHQAAPWQGAAAAALGPPQTLFRGDHLPFPSSLPLPHPPPSLTHSPSPFPSTTSFPSPSSLPLPPSLVLSCFSKQDCRSLL